MGVPRRVATLVSVALLIASCTAEDAGGAGPARSEAPGGPVAPAPDAPLAPPPESVSPHQPRSIAPDLIGVRFEAGWDPYPVFADGFDPWADATIPVSDWAGRLRGARPVPDGAVRIVVTTTLERRPATCFAFRRSVTGVRVDVAGLAGEAIGSQLLSAALLRATELERFASDDADTDDDRCEERFGGDDVGFHIVEVHAEACELPGGPAVVCASVGRLAYHLGTREFWAAETFVFDAGSGARLTRTQLLDAYDPERLTVLFDRIRDEIDVPHLTWVDIDLDLLHDDERVDVVPTTEGLRWRWSPYTHLVGSIDVVVPWTVLVALATSDGRGTG